MNQVIVVGNMGQDPKRRETVSGNVVVSLSVAINRNYKDNEVYIIDGLWMRYIIKFND